MIEMTIRYLNRFVTLRKIIFTCKRLLYSQVPTSFSSQTDYENYNDYDKIDKSPNYDHSLSEKKSFKVNPGGFETGNSEPLFYNSRPQHIQENYEEYRYCY